MHSALVITVEGMGTSLIGAYGASHAFTPDIDRLASEGLVLDRIFVDSLEPCEQLDSLWTGRHAMQARGAWNLWSFLEAEHVPAALITDCSEAALAAQQLGCASVTLVATGGSEVPCNDNVDCAVTRVFAAAADELSGGSRGLVWIHSRGLRNAWDAPLRLREKFIDPEDPAPPDSAVPPGFVVDADTDPDIVVGWGQVAAAQASVIDEAVGVLRRTLADRTDAAAWSVVLGTLGGVPLGEHGYVGWGRPRLTGEEIMCAAIILPSQRPPIGSRRSELCQLPDLVPMILECLLPPDPLPRWESPTARRGGALWGRSPMHNPHTLHPVDFENQFKLAMLTLPANADRPQSRWIRTPAWSAVLRPDEANQLYVKPDDRWEVSDIASRRRDILEHMLAMAAAFEQAIANNDRDAFPEVDEVLCGLMR